MVNSSITKHMAWTPFHLLAILSLSEISLSCTISSVHEVLRENTLQG